MRPLPVWRAVAAPWFAQPGGGMRYRATYSLSDLVGLGYLVELTMTREIAEAATLRIVRAETSDLAQQEAEEKVGGAAASTVRITREEQGAPEEGRAAVTERITREAVEAGVEAAMLAVRDEAENSPATTDDGSTQEAAK